MPDHEDVQERIPSLSEEEADVLAKVVEILRRIQSAPW
jgi:hypothetical protein